MPLWVPDWSQNFPLHHFIPYERADSIYKDSFRSYTERMYEVLTVSDIGEKARLELRTVGYRYARTIDSSQDFGSAARKRLRLK
jgi:hypothetical protein